MLIDLQYRDDGFRVDVTLTTREEQALADTLIARDVWWPDRMDWIVFPVLALPRKRNSAAHSAPSRSGAFSACPQR